MSFSEKISTFNKSVSATAVMCIALIILLGFPANAQLKFTPYDDLPAINKSYKPAFDINFPQWAKLLYQSQINFNEINKGFELYMSQHPGEHSPVIRYYKIWRRAVSDYVLPDGTIQIPDIETIKRNMLVSQLEAGTKHKSALVTNSDWTFLGPKETFWLNESNDPDFVQEPCPWQVNVYSFDVAASDNNILYCGTETGYVNKTIDQGNTWAVSGQNYPFGGAVTSVAIHPANPDIVYVSAGNQVHKTFDGGAGWMPLLPASAMFSSDKLKIDPVNPDKIYAAAYDGIYRSLDAGLSWQKKWPQTSWDIEIKPGDVSTVYAITRNSSGNFSVVISTDGGDTFASESSFPSNIVESSGGLLAVTAANPDKLFVIMLSANDTPYLYRGSKSGSAWTWSLVATGKTAALPMTNYQGFFDLVLDVSPLNENIVLTGTASLYRSVNGGTTFTLIGGYGGSIPVHPDIQDLKMLPDGQSWVSTDGGFTHTTDNFISPLNSVAYNNGIVGSDMWGFDQGWNEDIVVGGRYHNGNTAISDIYGDKALRMGGAESATGWVIQGKSRHVAYNDLGNGWILPSYVEGRAEGRFIFSKYPNMEEYGGRRSNMVYHTNYYGTIYLGEGSSVWKSTDMGQSFDLLHTFTNMVLWLQISYSNPSVMYADVVGKGLYKSTNGGETWVAKPKLTDGTVGTPYWNGKLFFTVSPYDENTIYACLQNGTWTSDKGKIFKSTNGGTTWTDFSGSLENSYTKCIVVQPSANGSDIIYLFTTNRNGEAAGVYYRDETMTDWAGFNTNYPAGMSVNLALPFFRDGKLRVAGNGSVWESPMLEPDFTPIVNPWVEKPVYNCLTDTIFFDDHSILNHSGVTWHWVITPQPAYISDANARNPKVVTGAAGTYSVTLTVTKSGLTYSKTIPDMITVTTCPSIDDCNNPAELPKNIWQLVYADSQEPGNQASKSFDGNTNSFWHTKWSSGSPPYPHEIQINMGKTYQVQKFIYLTRQDGSENGRIKDFELYISDTTNDWGLPVHTGSFTNTSAPQTITLASPKTGRYFRLKALSEVNGNPWASAAEFTVVGCNYTNTGLNSDIADKFISAYPIPTNGIITLDLPGYSQNTGFTFSVFSSLGQLMLEGKIQESNNNPTIDISELDAGIYFVTLVDKQNVAYRIKVIKQ